MSNTREWHAWAKEIDAAIAGPEEAFGALAELAQGLFPEGLPDLFHMTWEDETTRVRTEVDPRADAEARLKAAEARFRTLVEQIPAVTYMDSIGRPPRMLYISPQVTELTGFTAEEWHADPSLGERRIHPDERDQDRSPRTATLGPSGRLTPPASRAVSKLP